MGSEFSKEDIICFCQFTDIIREQENWDRENLLLIINPNGIILIMDFRKWLDLRSVPVNPLLNY